MRANVCRMALFPAIKANYSNTTNRPLIIIRRELSKVTKSITTMSDSTGKKFGLLFDIDGVLLRGKEPIDVAPEAMKMIYQV